MQRLVMYAPGPKWAEAATREAALLQQADYFRKLEQEGVLVMAAQEPDGSAAMMLLRTPMAQTAKRFASFDPSVRLGVFSFRVSLFEPEVL